MAWVNHSILSRLKLRFALDMPTFFVLFLGRGEVQILQGIGHGGEAVDPAKLRVHTLRAESLAYRGARFHSLDTDTSPGEFIRHAPQYLCAVHIHPRRSG